MGMTIFRLKKNRYWGSR